MKNRFTTLCKKRAKHEALAKENSTSSYINLNNKRVIFPNGLNAGGSESAAPLKKMRYIQSQFPLSRKVLYCVNILTSSSFACDLGPMS